MSDYIDEYYCKDCNAFFHPGSISWAEHSLKYHNIQYQRIRNKETKMIEKFVIDQFNNTDLIQQSKNTNGALYQRINSLQRDLNIANAEVEKFKNFYNDMSVRSHPSNCVYEEEVKHLRERIKTVIEEHEKTIKNCEQRHVDYQYSHEHTCKYHDKLKKIQEAIEAFKS